MASRPKGYGLTAELNKKKAAKWDPELSAEAMNWIKAIVPDADVENLSDANKIHEKLMDGMVLCKLINTIKPESVNKINESKMAFKRMENIGNFLSACETIGVKKLDLFQTADLCEQQNMPQVINGIVALGRKAQNIYDGPILGPKEASENKREFSEEQLRAGQNIIGLQAGSNKFASQAGQNFGKTRAIID